MRIKRNYTPKFRELMLYVAEKSESDPRFGAVKLNKILYYSDFAAYRQLDQSITDAEYQHLEEGPAPKFLLPARDALISDDAARIEERSYFNRSQQRLVAIDTPDYNLFTAQELQIVDQVIDALWENDGAGVSDLSHREFGWATTGLNETIPYYTAWIGSDALTPEQLREGLEVAKRNGLTASAA